MSKILKRFVVLLLVVGVVASAEMSIKNSTRTILGGPLEPPGGHPTVITQNA